MRYSTRVSTPVWLGLDSGKLSYKYFRFGGCHIGLSTCGLVVQYLNLSHSNAGPRKCRSSRRNFVSISPRSWYIIIFGLEAAILDFPLPVWWDSIWTSPIQMLDLKRVGVALKISFLSHLARLDSSLNPCMTRTRLGSRTLWLATTRDSTRMTCRVCIILKFIEVLRSAADHWHIEIWK